MSELEKTTEAETNDFTDELSDEALDRDGTRGGVTVAACFHTACPVSDH